ncbi:hypothetical protein [Legionella tucsonensis]|uniref:Uncharacterized protein n=1 Tax=Legionella tucsonensis TaxID=40335 RepID=A0A0W0ZQS2_9GAMM|nr:hypothetical protein [Legionella tucsonensis]KTD71564.1 hypothetical protein Ltuc_2510 [Legionella tucsonensis]
MGGPKQGRIHGSVKNLRDHIEAVFNKEKEAKTLPKDVEEAAEGMLSDLQKLLEDYSEKNSKKDQLKLAEEAIKVIHKYQPKLEASPGFWNRIKAHINNFVEKLAGRKDLLGIDKTEFGGDQRFQYFKGEIKYLKKEEESTKMIEIGDIPSQKIN